MNLAEYLPCWNKLTDEEQSLLANSAFIKQVPAGAVIHDGGADCMGLLLVRAGQLRACIFSEEGKEITIYRLFERDLCLFSASCMMRSIQFDITVSAEKDSEVWVIPLEIFKGLMEKSVAVSNYINEIMGTRFTEVMWLIEQVMWKSFDKRLAAFLLEECNIENTETLKITHEQIAAHLGTAREVVTRMLKYFQTEEIVKITRGTVEIVNRRKLESLAE